MRIVVLGDLHMSHKHEHETGDMIKHVNGLNPDLVIPLGDFGCNKHIGTKAGLNEAFTYLSKLEAPVRPIIGNHDLHYEMGDHVIPKGSFAKHFIEKTKLEQKYDVMEFQDFRLFFICNDDMPKEMTCYCRQECYISDEQIDWIESKIQERPGVPCLFFSHAPIASSGLRDLPSVHIRSTNAYLNHNLNPFVFKELVSKYEEAFMWFSAHYHLGHHHKDSYSYRYGTHFFTTGVHTYKTRDANKHSRVIDILDNEVRISTLDHNLGELDPQFDWSMPNPISQYVQGKDSVHLGRASYSSPFIEQSFEEVSWCRLGEDCINKIWKTTEPHYMLLTDNDLLWDVDMEHGSIRGTYHWLDKRQLNTACITEEFVLKGSGKHLFYGPHHKSSFVRDDYMRPFKEVHLPWVITSMCELSSDKILISTEETMHIVHIDENKLWSEKVYGNTVKCIDMVRDGDKVFCLDNKDELGCFSLKDGTYKVLYDSVEDFHIDENLLVIIKKSNDQMSLHRMDRNNLVEYDKKVLPLKSSELEYQYLIRDDKHLVQKNNETLVLVELCDDMLIEKGRLKVDNKKHGIGKVDFSRVAEISYLFIEIHDQTSDKHNTFMYRMILPS